MKKALIIDDTKNIRLMLKKCLELEGYQTELASNGLEGLDFLEKQPFHLIFLDIKLPEVSGTEVLRRIRRKGILTPVIIMTAFPTVKNAVDCTQLGAITYLQKPFTAQRLHHILSELNLDGNRKTEEDSSFCAIETLILQKNWETAFSLLKGVLSEDPEDSRVYSLFGTVLEGMGKKERAEKFYQTAEIFKKQNFDSEEKKTDFRDDLLD